MADKDKRVILVEGTGKKIFRITVPIGAKLTFGPWSPPNGKGREYGDVRALEGTLRVYEGSTTASSCIAVFSGVKGYRDMSVNYEEQAVVEQGAAIWRSDTEGYKREESVKRSATWSSGLLAEGDDDGSEDPNEEDPNA